MSRIVAISGALLVIFVLTLVWIMRAPVKRPRKAANQNLTVLPKYIQRGGAVVDVDTTHVPTDKNVSADSLFITSRELLRLSPEVLDSVRVYLERTRIRSVDGTVHDVEEAMKILVVELYVRALAWGGMASDTKISMLYSTFNVVMERHPRVTPVVTLVFDDKRPNLQFRFQDVERLLGALEGAAGPAHLAQVRQGAVPARPGGPLFVAAPVETAGPMPSPFSSGVSGWPTRPAS
jgi:hypothetical protein